MNKIMKVMIYIGVIIILIGGVWMCFDLGQVFKKTAYTGNEIAKHVIMISLDGVYEADFDNLMHVSYTHLDVYKRQTLVL